VQIRTSSFALRYVLLVKRYNFIYSLHNFIHAQGKNTPLHLAAMFEKTKHAELLLEYGANPVILNEFGQNALQLLPKDAVRSTKLYFKKMFEVIPETLLWACTVLTSCHFRMHTISFTETQWEIQLRRISSEIYNALIFSGTVTK
jgi:hypothetical protein